MSTAIHASEVHKVLVSVYDKVEEVFSPLHALRRIVDDAEGGKCDMVNVAIVLESLVNQANEVLLDFVLDLREKYPADLAERAAYERERTAKLEAWKVNDLACDDAEFREALAEAMQNPARLKEALLALNSEDQEVVA